MIKTLWDYTTLAPNYLNRPDYAILAIDAMLRVSGVFRGSRVCDIGAGAAHLTLLLAKRGLEITSVEPNDAMRCQGLDRTAEFNNIAWTEGTGECTGQPNMTFDLVTFGSSFNVCNRLEALQETARILKPGGWFACMWNHRDLADPIQRALEEIIALKVSSFEHGTRREDQTKIINSSGLFGPVCRIEADVIHRQSIEDCIGAWRSHGTLQRQAGERFPIVIQSIQEYLLGLGTPYLQVPYTTRIWMAARLENSERC